MTPVLTTNSVMRANMKSLRKRLAYLDNKSEEKHNLVSFYKSEARAIRWAIQELEIVRPELICNETR